MMKKILLDDLYIHDAQLKEVIIGNENIIWLEKLPNELKTEINL